MAPRAYWKGYLRLSLVSYPISLFPATSEREKVSFHQINSKTGNRIRYRKVDEGTGEEVPADQIISGYEVGKREYIEITDKELEAMRWRARALSKLMSSFRARRSMNSITFVHITSPLMARLDKMRLS
jgi:Ku protein